jgi:hypothetical protein
MAIISCCIIKQSEGRVCRERKKLSQLRRHVLLPGDIRINELILMVKVSNDVKQQERGEDLDRNYLFTVLI